MQEREGRWRRLVAVIALCCLGVTSAARAQTADNVAVVINEASPASIRVGEHYVASRKVPDANVIRIKTTADETVDRAAYLATIENPIAAALGKQQLEDRVLYLVLTKGVPLRIAGTAGREGSGASVDSELTLLYRRLSGRTVLIRGNVDNPYFLGTGALTEAKPFTHREHDIYLVSRLDGFTVEDAIALIDRARAPATAGKIVLDIRDVLRNNLGDRWLADAAKQLSDGGAADRVVLEQTTMAARDVSPVLGYYSWGSSDPQNRVRQVGLGFSPGALAATFVSTDARTFKEPPAAWRPTGVPGGRDSVFGGSPHSLIGDLIREGVTGAAGQVSEPYFESVVRPDILFRAYLAGFNLIESYYLALPHLSWQTVIVGDPLCAPFERPRAAAADLDPGVDAATSLPAFLSARRLAAFAEQQPRLAADVVTLWVRARATQARGDNEQAKAALQEALAKAPQEAALRVDLAVLYSADGDPDRAIEQYERALEIRPKDVVALNNLAYALAVSSKRPADALPFASRAATLAPRNANVLDTVAWIEHLLGDHVSAAKRLDAAIRLEPQNGEIRLHAAIVYAELGARPRAEAELKAALQLAPTLENSDQVKQLRHRLGL